MMPAEELRGKVFDFMPSDSRDSVLAAVKADPGLTTSEIAEKTGISRTKAVNNCNALVKMGLLIATKEPGRGKGKWSYYPKDGDQ